MLKRGKRNGKPYAPQTIHNVHQFVHKALKDACNKPWKLIRLNPATGIELPKIGKSKPRNFKAKERETMLAAARPDDETFLMAYLFLACGLRRGELAALALDAIDLEARQISVKRTIAEGSEPDPKRPDRRRGVLHIRPPKTDSGVRTIAFPAELVDLIRAQIVRVKEAALKSGPTYSRDPMFLFPAPGGDPRKPAAISRSMEKLVKAAGIEGAQPCHGWRHTMATILHHSGTSLKTLQTRLGHANVQTTINLYVHPDPERDAQAAELLGNLLAKK